MIELSGSLTEEELQTVEDVDLSSLTDVLGWLRRAKQTQKAEKVREQILTAVSLHLFDGDNPTLPVADPDSGEKLVAKVISGVTAHVDVKMLVAYLTAHRDVGDAEAGELLERIAPRKASVTEFMAAINPDGLLTPEVATLMYHEEPKAPYVLFVKPEAAD